MSSEPPAKRVNTGDTSGRPRNLDRRRPKEEVLDYWEEYFMGSAFLAAMRSKDPVTQVGACIVDSDNKIVATGYNCMPRGCSDDVFSWKRGRTDKWDEKAFYVCHAEFNAILNAKNVDLKTCRTYVTMYPCNECAKAIIQVGIMKVIYYSEKLRYKGKSGGKADEMFDAAGVERKPYDRKNLKNEITIDFSTGDRNPGELFN